MLSQILGEVPGVACDEVGHVWACSQAFSIYSGLEWVFAYDFFSALAKNQNAEHGAEQ